MGGGGELGCISLPSRPDIVSIVPMRVRSVYRGTANFVYFMFVLFECVCVFFGSIITKVHDFTIVI